MLIQQMNIRCEIDGIVPIQFDEVLRVKLELLFRHLDICFRALQNAAADMIEAVIKNSILAGGIDGG